jgi:hypothetical protein
MRPGKSGTTGLPCCNRGPVLGFQDSGGIRFLRPRVTEETMISMPPALQDAPEACRILFQHWNEIRADTLVPRRSQLDPSQLLPILPRLQIVEVQSRSVVHCKLVGTGLRDLFGFDYTGRNFIEMAPPEGRRIRSYRTWQVINRPCATYFGGSIPFASGARAPVGGVSLPLLPDRAGGAPLVVAVIATVSERGWINEQCGSTIGMPEHFAFLDIGAGIPDRVEPPDDWPMD